MPFDFLEDTANWNFWNQNMTIHIMCIVLQVSLESRVGNDLFMLSILERLGEKAEVSTQYRISLELAS